MAVGWYLPVKNNISSRKIPSRDCIKSMRVRKLRGGLECYVYIRKVAGRGARGFPVGRIYATSDIKHSKVERFIGGDKRLSHRTSSSKCSRSRGDTAVRLREREKESIVGLQRDRVLVTPSARCLSLHNPAQTRRAQKLRRVLLALSLSLLSSSCFFSRNVRIYDCTAPFYCLLVATHGLSPRYQQLRSTSCLNYHILVYTRWKDSLVAVVVPSVYTQLQRW